MEEGQQWSSTFRPLGRQPRNFLPQKTALAGEQEGETSIAACLSAPLAAETMPTTISRSFSQGECAVAYEASNKVYSFKILKKESLYQARQNLPKSDESVACSDELKADLHLVGENCQVFCNPN